MSAASESAPPIAVRLASAVFEIQMSEPTHGSRAVLWLVSALCLILLGWASVAKLDIVAVAQGRLVPQTYLKIVQPAAAGIVREILVREGDAVERDQILVRLDPTVNDADRGSIERELTLQRLQLRRVEAELADRAMVRLASDDAQLFSHVESQRASHHQAFLDSLGSEAAARERTVKELAAAQRQLKTLEVTLPSYQRAAQAFAKLSQNNLVGSIQAEEVQREAIEKHSDLEVQRANVAALSAAADQHDQRLAQLKSTYASDLNQQRLAAITEIGRLEPQQSKVNFQGGLLELRAPQAGIVKELATTTIGAVVEPGTVLVSLVPQHEPLKAEVLIENKDIGFVAVGQAVRLKLAAYEFQKYGFLEGTVQTISADASTDDPPRDGSAAPPAGPAFKALIELKDQRLGWGRQGLPIGAGMQLTAEIVQGKRTVLEYLLSPVQRVTGEAAMER